MKIYYPKEHYNKNFRGLVFPLLKPFIKNEGFTDEQRNKLYGVSEKDFDFVSLLEEADLVILTMSWNYYVKTEQTKKAVALIESSAKLNKTVIINNAGDFGLKMPFFKNCLILRVGGYSTKLLENEQGIPSFIGDPLEEHYQTNQIFESNYTNKPLIGFCGQANPSITNRFKEVFYTVARNLKYHFGFSKEEPQQIISTSYLRARVLNKMLHSPKVETNFIIRKKYRAGALSKEQRERTTQEFYDNLKNSQYVVCLRGAGNFSVRLYETLAMGRIPVFVNTDCNLPLRDQIFWKEHVVWIEANEIKSIVEKIIDFHGSLSSLEFLNLQIENRRLWEEKLTLKGYFKNIQL